MNNNELLKYLPNKDVVFAGLHGSRAYGLDNKDSDYDLKFVWKLPLQNYLSVEDIKDTGYSKQLDNTDVTGWELRHFLRLVQKSNMTTLEVLQTSNLLDNDAFDELLNHVSLCFNVRGLALQYYKAGKAYYYKYKETENIKYLNNSYRCCTNFLYILHNNSLPSLNHMGNYNNLPSFITNSKVSKLTDYLNYFDVNEYPYNIYHINASVLNNCFRKILFT